MIDIDTAEPCSRKRKKEGQDGITQSLYNPSHVYCQRFGRRGDKHDTCRTTPRTSPNNSKDNDGPPPPNPSSDASSNSLWRHPIFPNTAPRLVVESDQCLNLPSTPQEEIEEFVGTEESGKLEELTIGSTESSGSALSVEGARTIVVRIVEGSSESEMSEDMSNSSDPMIIIRGSSPSERNDYSWNHSTLNPRWRRDD
jgi:hypothetical protein